jgi:1-acyl-sn-glycerol-3-phosphate acyltransferase
MPVFRFLCAVLRLIALPLWLLFITFTGYIYVLIYNAQPNRLLHLFWKVWGLILGLEIKMPKGLKLKPGTVLISNHISYLDIIVYGVALNPVFIGKKEIKSWPVLGFGADKIAGIFYIDRRRSQILHEKERLSKFVETVPRNLLFFPEGTTGEGHEVMSFKPAIFDMLLAARSAKIQPLSLKYTHINGKKITTKTDRRRIAWYNDPEPQKYKAQPLLQHLWQVLLMDRISIEIVAAKDLISVDAFDDRRALTATAESAVKKGFES